MTIICPSCGTGFQGSPLGIDTCPLCHLTFSLPRSSLVASGAIVCGYMQPHITIMSGMLPASGWVSHGSIPSGFINSGFVSIPGTTQQLGHAPKNLSWLDDPAFAAPPKPKPKQNPFYAGRDPFA